MLHIFEKGLVFIHIALKIQSLRLPQLSRGRRNLVRVTRRLNINERLVPHTAKQKPNPGFFVRFSKMNTKHYC